MVEARPAASDPTLVAAVPATARLVLASTSPARLALLRKAGIEPEVVASGVDEEAVVAALGPTDVAELVVALAAAKARAVADGRTGGGRAGDGRAGDGSLVLGCDSLFQVDGEVHGKPADADEAVCRIRGQQGRHGVLRTGHFLIDTASRQEVSGVEATTVRFGPMTDAEIDAYVATGEPLRVAGAFTLDGLSGPFVDGVDGDPSNVVGCSLPLLRRLLRELGVSVRELWT